MSNLVKQNEQSNLPTFWQDADKIKKLFAPKLTTDEFQFFMQLGISLNANPFMREIWAVKYNESTPASVFTGRDFYRKKAQELENYEGHSTFAIYENDDFSCKNGEVNHNFKLKNRGALIGAYCIVYVKNRKPFIVIVNINEYDKKQGTWKIMPETMICKVAESQALRGAFQGTFAGTYSEEENWLPIDHEVVSSQPLKVENNQNVTISQPAKKIVLTEEKLQLAIDNLQNDPVEIISKFKKYESTKEQKDKFKESIFEYLKNLDIAVPANLALQSEILKLVTFDSDKIAFLTAKIQN